MGIRYARMLPVADLSHLSASLRTTINASRTSFLEQDRGLVRRSNDNSFGSRATFFASWLDARGLDQHSAATLTAEVFPDLLAAYITEVRDGHNPKKRTDLAPSTLRLYLNAAAAVLTILTGKSCSTKLPIANGETKAATLPYLAEILGQCAAWRQPRPKKQCFTLPMFTAIGDLLRLKMKTMSEAIVFCSIVYAVYDWTRLGVFTGSRISEYGQSKIPKGQRFATIPNNKEAGDWKGWPLAFVDSDFEFFDVAMIRLPNSTCLDSKQASRLTEVHIRFRFDKSATNFTIRKYRRIIGAPFDPVQVCINIMRRAAILRIPANEPLGQYGIPNPSSPAKQRFCIRDSHVRDTMRAACRSAYPNKDHYCRLHIDEIVSHSNRVTAAVCLKIGGAKDEEIAFRLRWHISSVPTYLRECMNSIDTLMQQAIFGAMRNT